MTDIERQIAETVERVARALSRAGAPADVEDVCQEGFLIALEALAGFDPERGALPSYLRAVLRPTLGKAIARWAHPCSISDYHARVGGTVARDGVDDLLDETLTPEQLLVVAESRARAAAAIAEAMADMGRRAAELVALDPDAPSDEVGARAGVSGRRVRVARAQFRERVEKSAVLRDLAGFAEGAP